jgi:hypothetical protein
LHTRPHPYLSSHLNRICFLLWPARPRNGSDLLSNSRLRTAGVCTATAQPRPRSRCAPKCRQCRWCKQWPGWWWYWGQHPPLRDMHATIVIVHRVNASTRVAEACWRSDVINVVAECKVRV